jgi:hypothetical protein
MSAEDRSRAQASIRAFLEAARQPVALEPGYDPVPVTAGCWELIEAGNRLTLQVWTDDRNLVRRVLRIDTQAPGRIDLTIERFGKRSGVLQLLDMARPRGEGAARKATRQSFREVFRRMLTRQYPGWQIVELTAEPDLQHSLSPAYPRAFLRRGGAGRAAIAASGTADDGGALTFGLIWLDYLRRREPRTVIAGLSLFLPAGSERMACHRMRHLRRDAASWSAFLYRDTWEQPVDFEDAGNIESALIHRAGIAAVPDWLAPVQALGFVDTVECGAAISLRVRGLEFARCHGGEVRFGLGTKRLARVSNRGEIERLAVEIATSRDGQGVLSATAPERWLESRIRSNVTAIDAGLLPEPVYGQAPTITSGERGVVDLLAAGLDGRLCVIEVKASEDVHLPMQALDYWARVKWHLEAGDFSRCGYFRDVPLRITPPRLILVAPALHFHPTTETLLRFFPSEIDVEKIGVGANWRTELKVVLRERSSPETARTQPFDLPHRGP